MVLPLIPIIVGAFAGMTAEKGLDSIFGGSGTTKKDTKIGGEYHAAYEQYAPVQSYAPQIQYPDYQIMIDSPLSKQTLSKKQESSPELSGGAASGLDIPIIPLAVLGVAGLVVYGVVSKK